MFGHHKHNTWHPKHDTYCFYLLLFRMLRKDGQRKSLLLNIGRY